MSPTNKPAPRRPAPWRNAGRVGRPRQRDASAPPEEEWPEESDDFSWNDVFDVAEYWLRQDRVSGGYPADLPRFLVRALQQGPEAVGPAEVEGFYRRQGILRLRPVPPPAASARS